MEKDKMRGMRFRAAPMGKDIGYSLWITPELSFTHAECPDEETRKNQKELLGWVWTKIEE